MFARGWFDCIIVVVGEVECLGAFVHVRVRGAWLHIIVVGV